MRRVVTLLVFGSVTACGGASSPQPALTSGVEVTPNCASEVKSFGTDVPPAGEMTPARAEPQAPDPIVTDGDKYQVILENARVRVLRYHDKPGDKTQPHYHAEFVLYALAPFRRRLTFPDGTVKERDFAAGDVIWMPAQVHTGENTGETDTEVILVENRVAGQATCAAVE